MGRKGKVMEAVKAEGSWHQIAYALAEAFDDEGEQDDDPEKRERAAEAEAKAAKEKRKATQAEREAKGQGIRGAIKQRIGKKIAQGGEVKQAQRQGDIDVAKARSAGRAGAEHAKAQGAVDREKARQAAKTKLAKARGKRYGATTLAGVAGQKVIGTAKRLGKKMGLAAHTEYKQIGLHLAEAFGLIESAGERGPQAE
jgi:hypothetical protein